MTWLLLHIEALINVKWIQWNVKNPSEIFVDFMLLPLSWLFCSHYTITKTTALLTMINEFSLLALHDIAILFNILFFFLRNFYLLTCLLLFAFFVWVPERFFVCVLLSLFFQEIIQHYAIQGVKLLSYMKLISSEWL